MPIVRTSSRPARCACIKNLFKYPAVMHRRICYIIIPNQLVFDISAYMILIAKKRLAVLLGPAGIGILLAVFIVAPVLGNFAAFDLLVFLTAVTLPWSLYDTWFTYMPLF